MLSKSQQRRLTVNGETHTVREWSDKTGLAYRTIKYRMDSGWPPEEIIRKHSRYHKKADDSGIRQQYNILIAQGAETGNGTILSSYDVFSQWMVMQGWKPGMNVVRRNPSLPYTFFNSMIAATKQDAPAMEETDRRRLSKLFTGKYINRAARETLNNGSVSTIPVMGRIAESLGEGGLCYRDIFRSAWHTRGYDPNDRDLAISIAYLHYRKTRPCAMLDTISVGGVPCRLAAFWDRTGEAAIPAAGIHDLQQIEMHIRVYHKAFTRISVFIPENMYTDIESNIIRPMDEEGESVGIYAVTPQGTISETMRKEPQDYGKRLSRMALFAMLSKRETRSYLQELKGTAGDTMEELFDECDDIPIQDFQQDVMETMRKRPHTDPGSLDCLPGPLQAPYCLSKEHVPVEDIMRMLDTHTQRNSNHDQGNRLGQRQTHPPHAIRGVGHRRTAPSYGNTRDATQPHHARHRTLG